MSLPSLLLLLLLMFLVFCFFFCIFFLSFLLLHPGTLPQGDPVRAAQEVPVQSLGFPEC